MKISFERGDGCVIAVYECGGNFSENNKNSYNFVVLIESREDKDPAPFVSWTKVLGEKLEGLLGVYDGFTGVSREGLKIIFLFNKSKFTKTQAKKNLETMIRIVTSGKTKIVFRRGFLAK